MVDAEKRVLDALDLDGLVNCLRGLIAIPSVGGQETPAQRYFAAEMLRIGLDVDEWEIDFDKLREHPAYSMSILRKEGIGVVGEYGGTKKSLMLNGHIDVVSPGEMLKWRYPPWSGIVADGRVHGRGSADMKSGLACALYAVKAVIDSGFPLKGKVLLSSVIGEEDGGVGALDMVLHGCRADAAIIPEPSDLDAVPAHAGVMAFRVTVQGKASHASLRDEGINAIEKAIPLLEALKKLESRRTARIKDPLYSGFKIPSPLSIGKIQGGEWPGTVTENLYFEGRVGVHTDETCEMVRKQVELAVAKAANQDLWLREHRPVVDWNGYRFDPASISTDHPIMETVKRAYIDVTGSAPLVSGKTYSSDMRLLINYGQTPTMIFGPGELRQAHSANESISIDSLEKAAKTLVLTILRWCI
ncbi:MAG: ArgE/DapE family deacylase [Candidatus Bathyarchaeota archaeon]|nr:ArgE/DapE family deacylase [Candidatus Bathyarchaeota archaeon]